MVPARPPLPISLSKPGANYVGLKGCLEVGANIYQQIHIVHCIAECLATKFDTPLNH